MTEVDVPPAATGHDPDAPAEPGPTVAQTTALAQRDPTQLIMSDDELRRTYRLAEGLAGSGMWKDIKKAEQSFAKIVIGRDLGLTPAQSMQGIQIVEGGIQMHYSTLGAFIRSRPGYDYRSAWIKRVRPCVATLQGAEPEQGEIVGETTGPNNSGRVYIVRFENGRQARVPEEAVEILAVQDSVVWIDEEDPLDLRPVFGAVTVFYVAEKQRGVSRFTLDDARAANLIKSDSRAAWNTSQRNMLLARSMSNGVKWFVPEIMNGMPIYAPGELEDLRGRKSLTASTGDGDDAGSGIDLGPRVEKIIERATELGHRGLSNRAMVEMAVGNRAPGVVNDWCVRASQELDRFAEEKAAAAEAPETDVAAGDPEERPVEVEPEEVSGTPVEPDPEAEPEGEPEPDVEPPAEAETVDDAEERLRLHLEDEQQNQ